ncbi:hypothetical protein AgCh_024659 [Apium graveolens]
MYRGVAGFLQLKAERCQADQSESWRIQREASLDNDQGFEEDMSWDFELGMVQDCDFEKKVENFDYTDLGSMRNWGDSSNQDFCLPYGLENIRYRYSLKNSLLDSVKEGDVREKLEGLQGYA